MQKKSFRLMAVVGMEVPHTIGFNALAEDTNKQRNTENGS